MAAQRALDRTTGVLSDHQTTHTLRGGEPLIRFEPDRDTETHERAVDCHAALCAGRDRFGPDWPIALDFAKEDIRRVLAAQGSSSFMIPFHPRPDRRHRQLVSRDHSVFDQQSSDRHVGTAVLPVVADPDGAAPLQPHAPRPLDLQKECVNRIVDPEEFQPAPGKRSILYLGTRRRLSTAIWGRAVKRDLIAATALPRAVELDLVISGEEPFRIAVVRYGERSKTFLEKFTGSPIVPGRQCLRRVTQ